MKQLVIAERLCLLGHIMTMPFGWAGLLLVLPHPELILNLGASGQTFFQLSMAWGGVVNILLGTAVVAIYAYRKLGLWHWLTFMLPAVCLSLGSELLGTSTGLPFGDYHYLSGLGYKIGGLVPFTIPLSWFYMGLASYLIARAGLNADRHGGWVRRAGAIALGAMLFTSWDLALEPAMSQTMLPFWYWERAGAFFGTPYQNYAGWFGTSALFMTVASLFWRKMPVAMERSLLGIPLVVYLSNYIYAAVISAANGFSIPVLLGLFTGFIPAVVLWRMAQLTPASTQIETTTSLQNETTMAAVKVGVK